MNNFFFRLAGLTKKTALFCIISLIIGLTLFLFRTAAYAAAVDLKGIETLLETKNYSLALEKGLEILNTKKSLLAPGETAKLHYLIGIAYKKNGNADMAITYLKKIETQFPNSEYLKQSWLELADIYKEDYFQRDPYLEKIFEKFPKTPEAILAGIELSKDYLYLKNFQKAIPVIEKMVKEWHVEKDYPELELHLAIVYAGMDDYPQAFVYLKTIENKIPKIIDSNPSYLYEAGKIYYHNRNIPKTINYLTKLINVYPTYTDIDEAAIMLAQAYTLDKNPFLGAVFLIRVAGNLTDQKKQYGVLLNLGKILATMKEDDLAKIKANYPRYCDAKKLLTIVKENSPDSDQKKTAAILLSGEFEKSGEFKKAADNYYRFLETNRDPTVEKLFKENMDVYLDSLQKDKNYDEIFRFWVLIKARKSLLSGSNLVKIGAVLFDMELYSNAQEIYSFLDQYTMFSQYWPIVRPQLARIYYKTGQYDEYLETRAKMMLDTAAEPEKSEFLYYTLGAFQHENHEEELNNTLKAITLNPQTIVNIYQYQILLMKAEALGNEKDPASGTAALNLFKELANYKELTAPLRVQLLVKTGDLNYNLGKWEPALENYNNAREYLDDKEDTETKEWILFRKISIYRQTNRPGEAQKTTAELKKLNPNSFWIKQAEKEKRKDVG